MSSKLHTLSPEQRIDMDPSPVERTVAVVQPSGSSQLSPTDSQMASEQGSPLYKLPTELLFMIFSQCIVSGHPQFMQASRALQEIGQALISKKGIYRMRLGYEKDNNCQHPSQETVKTIQNVDVTADTKNIETQWGPISRVWDRLKPFTGSQYTRGKCHIILKTASVYDWGNLIMLLAKIERFERLILRIEVDNTNGPGSLICICLSEEEEIAVEWFCNLLEWKLGKAEIIKLEDCLCLTFYPRKYAEAVASGIEG